MKYEIGCYSNDTVFAWGGGLRYATIEDAAAALTKEDLRRYTDPDWSHMGRCVMTTKTVRNKKDDNFPETVAVIIKTDRDLGLR